MSANSVLSSFKHTDNYGESLAKPCLFTSRDFIRRVCVKCTGRCISTLVSMTSCLLASLRDVHARIQLGLDLLLQITFIFAIDRDMKVLQISSHWPAC